MNILLLGGTYFIGRAILESIQGAGEITLLNRGTRPVPIPGVGSIKADRTNPKEMEKLQSCSFDVIVDVSGTVPLHIENLLQSLGGAPAKYIYLSSTSVYDRNGCSSFPHLEGARTGGDFIWGDYGKGKSDCEQMILEKSTSRNFILRPPFMYGPHNYIEREQFIWKKVLNNEVIEIPGNGETLIQFCYTRDLGKIIEMIIKEDHHIDEGVYNVGENRYYTFNQYVDLVSSIAGKKPGIKYSASEPRMSTARFPFKDYHNIVSVDKQEAAFFEGTSLEQGLVETYKWFTEQPGATKHEPF